MSDGYVGSEDLGKTIDLLREYTDKLRHICHYKLSSDNRIIIFFTIIVITFSVLTFMYLETTNFDLLNKNTGFSTIIIASIISIGAVILSRQLFLISGKRNLIEANNIANILIKLVQMCSQYQEHSKTRLGTDIEFSLRLAEAEAILETYKSVFKSYQNDSTKKYNENL